MKAGSGDFEGMTVPELHAWALSLGLVPFERVPDDVYGEAVEYRRDGYSLSLRLWRFAQSRGGGAYASVAYKEPGPGCYGATVPCETLEGAEKTLRLWCAKRGWDGGPMQMALAI